MFRQKCTSLSSQLLKIVTSQWFVQNDTHLARTLNANFLSSKWCLKYSVCTFLFSITMTKHGSICEHISETKENIELWQHFENLRPKQKNVPTLDTTLASDRLQPHVVCFMKIKTQMLREQNTDSLQQQSLKRWGVRRKIIFIHAKPSLSVSSRDGYQRQYYLYFIFFWYGPIWVKYYRAPMIMKSNATICRFWSMSSKVVTGGWRGLAIFHGALERNSAHPSD